MRIFTVLILLFTSTAIAQDDAITAEGIKNAMNNVSMEYATCAAYFAHVSFAAKNSGDQKVLDTYSSLYDEIIVLAVMAAKNERTDEMALKVTKARIDLEMEEMALEIENDYANFSLIMQKHAKRCQFVAYNTEAFMEEWFEKERSQ